MHLLVVDQITFSNVLPLYQPSHTNYISSECVEYDVYRGVDNILTLGGKPYVGKLTLILGTTDTDPHVLHIYNRQQLRFKITYPLVFERYFLNYLA